MTRGGKREISFRSSLTSKPLQPLVVPRNIFLPPVIPLNPLTYKKLHGVTYSCKGLHWVSGRYKGLKEVTRSYRRLQGVTYRVEAVPLNLGVPEIDRKCFVTATPKSRISNRTVASPMPAAIFLHNLST